MNKTLQICFVGVLVALAGCGSVPVGGGGSSGSGDASTPSDAGGQVNSDIVSSISVTATQSDMGQTVLDVSVEADAEAAPLSVTVSGPRDETVVGAVLSESDLLDGSETVGNILDDNPLSGEYTVYIQRGAYGSEKEVVAEKSMLLEHGQPVIEDVSASGGEAGMGEGYTVTDAEIVVSNSGDIPLRIADIDVLSPSDDGFIPYTTGGVIEPGDVQTYSTAKPYNLPRFSSQRTTIEIAVRYGDGKEMSESVTVTAESG